MIHSYHERQVKKVRSRDIARVGRARRFDGALRSRHQEMHANARQHRTRGVATRARPRRAGSARLHQPRPRRGPGARLRRRRDAGARRTPCSTPPGSRASATSTRRARTAVPRSSWPPGSHAATIAPERRDRRLEVGLHLHRRLAGRGRARTRSRTTRWPVLRRQSRESRELLGATSTCTRSTPPRWRAACSTTARARASWRDLRDDGLAIGLSLSGPRPGRDAAPGDGLRRRRRAALRLRAGDLEPAGALGRAGAARRARGRHGRHRQGGAGQRAADRAQRRRRRSPPRAGAWKTWPRGCGCTLDALALAAVLAQPWADVVLSGAAAEAQLASNLLALDVRVGRGRGRGAARGRRGTRRVLGDARAAARGTRNLLIC